MTDIPHDPLDASVKPIGPYYARYYKLTVGGYQVPHILIYPTQDGQWDLTVDERFTATFTDEELKKFGWILAQAMAVSAGYVCHGSGKRQEPFNVRVVGIGFITSELPQDEQEQQP